MAAPQDRFLERRKSILRPEARNDNGELWGQVGPGNVFRAGSSCKRAPLWPRSCGWAVRADSYVSNSGKRSIVLYSFFQTRNKVTQRGPLGVGLHQYGGS